MKHVGIDHRVFPPRTLEQGRSRPRIDQRMDAGGRALGLGGEHCSAQGSEALATDEMRNGEPAGGKRIAQVKSARRADR